MKLGQRQYAVGERTRTAIGSMVNGTIGGASKIGMPIVQTVRAPLVADFTCPAFVAPVFNDWESGNLDTPPLTTVRGSLPPNAGAGDTVLALVVAQEATGITAAAGWSPVAFETFSDSSVGVWQRTLDGSETEFTATLNTSGYGQPCLLVVPAADYSELSFDLLSTVAPTVTTITTNCQFAFCCEISLVDGSAGVPAPEASADFDYYEKPFGLLNLNPFGSARVFALLADIPTFDVEIDVSGGTATWFLVVGL